MRQHNARRAKRLVVLAFLISLLCSFSAFAGEEEIAFSEALERFYRYNYDILIHKYEIDKTYADYVGAKLLPNPSFTFNDTVNELRVPPHSTDATTVTFRIDQLFELGGKRELRTNSARESLESAKLAHRDTIRILLVGFSTAFYNLKLDDLNTELARDALQRFDRTLEIAEKRFNAGHLSLVDYRKLQVARIDLEIGLTNAENQLRNDGEQFRFLIGSEKPLKPAVSLQERFPEVREEDLVDAAVRNRFDLLSLQAQLKAADYNRSLAKAQRIPDVTAGLEYDLYGSNYTPAYGFGFSIPLPVFNQNQGDILRKTAEYSQLELQIERTRKQIVLDVRQALNNRSASLKVFGSYKDRKAGMDELLGRSEKAFSLGGITVLDLLDTARMHREFVSKYNQAQVQANLNERLLKIATGEFQ